MCVFNILFNYLFQELSAIRGTVGMVQETASIRKVTGVENMNFYNNYDVLITINLLGDDLIAQTNDPAETHPMRFQEVESIRAGAATIQETASIRKVSSLVSHILVICHFSNDADAMRQKK